MDGAADGKVIENLYHTKDVNIGIVISQVPQLNSKMNWLQRANMNYVTHNFYSYKK
jgi:hypothetical protein